MEAIGGLGEALEAALGKLHYWMEARGRSLAARLSLIAEGWGYRSASRWAEDEGFIRYLTAMELNRPRIWG
jgi:hypothetical protein